MRFTPRPPIPTRSQRYDNDQLYCSRPKTLHNIDPALSTLYPARPNPAATGDDPATLTLTPPAMTTHATSTHHPLPPPRPPIFSGHDGCSSRSPPPPTPPQSLVAMAHRITIRHDITWALRRTPP
ncbi:hypothetical protein THAOC_00519 [Thalassiosira oceanica]|uniref:Uncharacterized protein n=1 Tax=Thalassiosira oceanica TaxID=159749 RepID=K0TK86_THAOC|nr:hypothetical protein THAOC_00519 [Thalassiosira oceanica]|eukprot:EJK77634.1 hypothetical protein THAOC_00519 [Thalassiosira oceanica]